METLYSIIALISIILLIKVINHTSYKINKQAGDSGETKVAHELEKLDREYAIINNVRCAKYQIDHMVIHENSKSIFVIETKNWGGAISGNYNDHKWVQNKNNNLRYLYNPILQNATHCKHIRKLYKGYTVYNIVVFINNRSIPSYSNVIPLNMLRKYIIARSIPDLSNSYSNSIPIAFQTDRKSMRL